MRANSSVNREHAVNLRNVFSVFETIGKNSERESFCLGHSLFARGAVDQDSRKFRDFADPTAIGLRFDIYGKIAHELNGTTAFAPEKET
jgi:hypothetical protein